MLFAGIDLAWSDKNTTSICVLESEKNGFRVKRTALVVTDEEIIEAVQGVDIIAIDAPLHVPNETGRRPAEDDAQRIFGSYNAGAYPANRNWLERICGRIRGADLVAQLEEAGFSFEEKPERNTIIEVYPHPATVALFDLETVLPYKSRKNRSYEIRWQALRKYNEHLGGLPIVNVDEYLENPVGKRGKAFKDYEDTVDSILCAYIPAYLHNNPEDLLILGNKKEGCITTIRL